METKKEELENEKQGTWDLENIRKNLESEIQTLEGSLGDLQAEYHKNLSSLGSLQTEFQHQGEQLRSLMEERTSLIQQMTTTNNQLNDVSVCL